MNSGSRWTEQEMTWIREAQEAGFETAATVIGAVVTDVTSAEAFLHGYETGAEEVICLCPAYLSGEWAGESIPEILRLGIGQALPDGDVLNAIDEAFTEAFWAEAVYVALGWLSDERTV